MRSTKKILCAFGAAAALALASAPATAEKFTLRMGAGHPGGPSLEQGPAVYTLAMEHFFAPEVTKRVAERTKHEVEFIHAYGGTIVGVNETLEGVRNGIIDIGGYCTCFEMSRLFVHNFPYFVPFSTGDAEAAIRAARAVYDRHPELTEVLEKRYNQKLLGLSGYDNYHLSTTMDWKTVDDLKGVKIAGAGPNLPWLEFAGAIPVQASLPEGYLAMSTGVYNGWIVFPSSYLGFKYYEPAPYYKQVGFGAAATNVLTINLRTWRKLPEEVREIIAEVGREYEALSGKLLNKRQAEDLARLGSVGAKVEVVSEEVRRQWANALAKFPNEMAQRANRQKMPGSSVIRAYIEEVEKTGYQYPVKYQID